MKGSNDPFKFYDNTISFSMENIGEGSELRADLLIHGDRQLICKGLIAKMELHPDLVDMIMTVAVTYWHDHPDYIQKIPGGGK